MPKVLTIISSPGPAESLGLVVKKMRNLGLDTELIDASEKDPPGLRRIFEEVQVEYRQACEFGNIKDYFSVSEDFMNKVVDSIKPDKILVGVYRDATGEKLTPEDVTIRCAKNHNIPVFQYVDMWDNWFPKKNLNLTPDIFLVQDEHAKKEIMEKNREGKKGDIPVMIVGNPGLEKFLQDKAKHKKFFKEDFGFNNKRVIVYFGQNLSAKNEISFPWVVNCKKDDDILIFSRHPRDKRDYFKQYLKYPGVIELEKLGVSSNDVLDFCDICITHTSTMGMKAALLGIKTINLTLENEKCSPLVSLGGSQQVNSERELNEAIEKKFIVSDNFKQILQKFMTGNALNKIVKLFQS